MRGLLICLFVCAILLLIYIVVAGRAFFLHQDKVRSEASGPYEVVVVFANGDSTTTDTKGLPFLNEGCLCSQYSLLDRNGKDYMQKESVLCYVREIVSFKPK